MLKRFFIQSMNKVGRKEKVGPSRRKISIALMVEKIKGLKKLNWARISVITNIVIFTLAIVGLAGWEVIHQSDTNPNFCGMCHIMQPNVNTYLTSNHMDNIHMQAGVQCKDCHDYSVIAEVTSGVNFLMAIIK